jgi:hypothetical protein
VDGATKVTADALVDWAGRYEDLRRLAWQEPPQSWGCPALTLFLRQGFVAWMQAWPQQVGQEGDNAKQTRAIEPTPLSLPCDLRSSFVGLLAEVILHHRLETSP